MNSSNNIKYYELLTKAIPSHQGISLSHERHNQAMKGINKPRKA